MIICGVTLVDNRSTYIEYASQSSPAQALQLKHFCPF